MPRVVADALVGREVGRGVSSSTARGVAMIWLRSLAAELFPQWHERRLLQKLRARNEAGLAALKDLIRTVEEGRTANVDNRTPGTRTNDPDRPVESKVSNLAPPRDCHEWPSDHAKSHPKARSDQTDKPVTGA
jgi:hypothetical protein